MPIDRNYPRLDVELNLTRTRMAEASEHRLTIREHVADHEQARVRLPDAEPVAVEPHTAHTHKEHEAPAAYAPSLPEAAPVVAATPTRSESKAPAAPAAHDAKLPATEPQQIEVSNTLPEAMRAGAHDRRPPPTAPTPHHATAADTRASIPVVKPEISAPRGARPADRPMPAETQAQGHAGSGEIESTPMLDYSRIVWRDGPSRRRY